MIISPLLCIKLNYEKAHLPQVTENKIHQMVDRVGELLV